MTNWSGENRWSLWAAAYRISDGGSGTSGGADNTQNSDRDGESDPEEIGGIFEAWGVSPPAGSAGQSADEFAEALKNIAEQVENWFQPDIANFSDSQFQLAQAKPDILKQLGGTAKNKLTTVSPYSLIPGQGGANPARDNFASEAQKQGVRDALGGGGGGKLNPFDFREFEPGHGEQQILYEPVVLDLDGDGVIDLVAKEDSTAFFDVDDDGFREKAGWVKGNDGFLAIDLDGDNLIEDARELSFALHTAAEDTDLEALGEVFDTNQDGKLDAQDTDFGKFRIWQDYDQDGASDGGELQDLSSVGIDSIGLEKTDTTATIVNGNVVYGYSDYFRTDLSTGTVGDVALAISTIGVAVDETGKRTFNIEGAGKLHVASEPLVGFVAAADDDIGVIGSDMQDYITSGYVVGNTEVLLDGRGGDDTLIGGVGADWLIGGNGADTLEGGAGDDVLFIDNGDSVSGGAGFDIADVVGLGAISIDLLATDIEAVFGNEGNDTLDATGVTSDVVLDGQAGDDILVGGDGNDILSGGEGADTLTGGDGDDIFVADSLDIGNVAGGSGRDALIVTEEVVGVAVDLGSKGLEIVLGGGGDDTFTHSGGWNVAIDGGDGDDQVSSGVGADLLAGSAGADTLYGSYSSDTYVFGRGDGRDTISDTYTATGSQLEWGKSIVSYYEDNQGTRIPQYSAPAGTGWALDSTTIYTEILRTYWEDGEWVNQTQDYVWYNRTVSTSTELDAGEDDTIAFGAGITAADLVIRTVGGTLEIALADPDNVLTVFDDLPDRITILEWTDTKNRIETLRFDDDSRIGLNELLTRFSIGTTAVHLGQQMATLYPGSDIGMAVAAGGSADELHGTEGGDIRDGGAGDDVIATAGGDDILVGGAGADELHGGTGSDTVSYAGSSAAVTVDLAAGTATGGDAAGDTLTEVENLVGSAQADTLTGDGNDNIIEGGAGADTLTGGAGIDTLSYESSDVAVTVDLSSDTVSGGHAASDVVSGFENALGSDYNDSLTGTAEANVLTGGEGADTLTGGAGDDSLFGGKGADVLTGGVGSGDTLKDAIDTLSPVAYWRLGESSGTTAADAASTHNGTYESGVTLGADGVGAISDTAGDFDGSNDFVKVAYSSDFLISDGTISLWFNIDTMDGGSDALIAMNDEGDSNDARDAGNFSIYVKNGEIRLYMEDNSTDHWIIDGTVTAGQWHHFALNFGSGGMKLYLDGTEIGSNSNYTGGIGNATQQNPLVIGGSTNAATPGTTDLVKHEFNGKIDEVAIFDGALTATQISDLSTAGVNAADNTGGDDFLHGWEGDDIIDAGDGNDTVIGGEGADSLTGGTGTDTLSYVESQAGVTVNLGTSSASGGDAAGDTIGGFEDLRGSAKDDTLTGDSGANVIEGGAGGDAIDGGAGNDTVTYANAKAGVAADLGIGGGTLYEMMSESFDDLNAGRQEGTLSFDTDDDRLVTHGTGTSVVYGEGAGDTTGWMVASLVVNPGAATGVYGSAAVLSETYTVTAAGEPPIGTRYVKVSTGSDDSYIRVYDAAGNIEIQYNFFRDLSQGARLTFAYNRDTGDLGFYKDGRFVGSHKWTSGLNVMAGHLGVEGQIVRIATEIDLRQSLGLLNDDARNDSFTSIENLTGSDFGDALTGDAGANTLTGGAGDDTLTGGAGTDAAVFAGNATDYSVVDDAGTVTVSDLDAVTGGDDGTDTLTEIESLVFADRTLTLDGATNNAPVAVAGSATTYEGNAIDGKLAGYDVGAVSTVLTYSLVGTDGGAVNGTVTILDSAAGTYRYTPDAGYTGTDSFTFRVTDAAGTPLSDDAAVSVDVNPEPFEIEHSILLSSGTAQELSITPVSAGDRKTFTFSTWAKRGRLDANNRQILSAGAEILRFSSTGELQLVDGATELRTTTATYQDDDWHHVVLSVDTTQATAADRIKLYMDGVEVTGFSASNDPALNEDFEINSTALHRISIGGVAYDQKFDGYLADIRFIDGQALDADTFGTTSGSAWLPRGDSGGYGTNGYRLDFADDLAMGNDVSGNDNDWTATAMVVENRVTNTPTNNYMLFDDTTAATGFPYDYTIHAGTHWAVQETAWDQRHATGRFSSGKHYWEVKIHFLQSPSVYFGVTGATSIEATTGAVGDVPSAYGYGLDASQIQLIGDTDNGRQNNTLGATGQTWNNNDVIGIAVDADAGRLWMRRNGGAWFEGDPEAGALSSLTWTGGTSMTPWFMTYGVANTTNYFEINAGQQAFAFAAPEGFGDLADPPAIGEVIDGSVGADAAAGTVGDDVIDGGARDDILEGREGADTLDGGDGDDTLDGGAGADVISGGTGLDEVTFAGSLAGVTVDLAAGTGLGGDAEGDTYSSIENVTGSGLADTLTGNSADNILDGGTGDDTINGGAGADSLVGGDGTDTVSYAGSARGVTVDLAAATASGGDAEGDTISGFENITGSDRDDMLTGDGSANTLSGGGGDDVLDGGATSLNTDTFETAITAHNPVAYWRLGESSGTTAADDAGTAQDGTYTNGVVLAADGIGSISDTAADFDGVDDRVDVSHHSDLELANGTIQFWFKADTLGTGDQGLMAKNNSGYDAGSWLIYMSTSGKVHYRVEGSGSASSIATNSNDVTVGNWHHVAATFGSGGMKLYFDGVLKGTRSSRTDAMSSNTLAMVIGALQWGGSPSKYFNGKIDEVAILDFAVTDQQASDLYDDGIAAVDSGSGSDVLDGGAGVDTVSYAASSAGVTVDLSAGTGTGGDAAGDVLTDIENVTGSAFDDGFTSSSSDNAFTGGAGTDSVTFAGNVADYSVVDNAGTVTVTDLDATAGGDDGTDVLSGIESLVFADRTLTLNGATNNAPVSTDGSAAAVTDTVIEGRLAAYDVGAGSTVLTYSLVGTDGGALHGTVTILDSSAGTYRYTPDAGYTGTDSFTFRATDAAGTPLSDDGVVSVEFFADTAAQTLTGSSGTDALAGTALVDTMTGGGRDDVLDGKAGVDTLDGGAGDDTLIGGAGADVLTGGTGTDLADYAGSSAGVTVDLAVGTGLGGDAEGDTLTGIENVTGSGQADVLTGDSADNVLDGGAGDDTINGGAGADSLIGGAGADTLSYAGSAAGVSVDLAAGTVSGGDAAGDTISGFEHVTGSDNNDTLIGDSGANTLDGGAGTDVLDGGLGSDTYLFGRGSDTDIVVNGDSTVATDKVLFGAGIDKEQLWFQRDGADLNVSVIGTDDELVVRDWYASAQKRVDTFETAAVDSLTEANVQQLVAAMAAFDPPSGSSLDLPQAVLDELQPTLTAAWT